MESLGKLKHYNMFVKVLNKLKVVISSKYAISISIKINWHVLILHNKIKPLSIYRDEEDIRLLI